MENKVAVNTKAGLAFLALALTLVLGILIGSLVSSGVSAESESPQELTLKGGGTPLVLDKNASLAEGFAKVVETVGPAVVNIRAEGVIEGPAANDSLHEFFGQDLFDRFRQQPPRERKFQNLGSGVIVDSAGYVITNYHVIARGDKIKVKLATGKVYRAEIVGADRQSDLAVLQIRDAEDLPYAKIGNSSSMRVGDWVLAIGSPFGMERTVTSGIISATERVIPTGIFGDYIQTDAAINPGNSGGPLVNMKGEVVGINSFIQTRSGGSNGIGFAIPSTVFVNSYNQLVTKGHIERGWLGVSMNSTPMTPEMAEYFGVAGEDPEGLRNGDGVLITNLIDETGKAAETGPAYRAGVRPEDVIVQFDGNEVTSLQDLRLYVANTPPGREVPLVVVRKGDVMPLSVTLAQRTLEDQEMRDTEGISLDDRVERNREKEIGIEVRTLRARDLGRAGIEDEISGVVVLDITPGSLADDAALQSGQIITHVNGEEVNSADGFKSSILAMDSGSGVILRVLTMTPQTRQMTINYTSFVKP